jgi:hypothetical protein
MTREWCAHEPLIIIHVAVGGGRAPAHKYAFGVFLYRGAYENMSAHDVCIWWKLG